MASEQFLSLERQTGQLVVQVFGDWVIENAAALKERLGRLPAEASGFPRITLHCGGIHELDTSGAWILHKAVRDLEQAGFATEVTGFKPAHQRFLDRLETGLPAAGEEPRRVRETLADQVERLGEWTVYGVRHTGEAALFLLRLGETLMLSLVLPFRLRFASLVANMHRSGVNAIPIVALLAFLISIVLAYQGATQLARFGAEIFTVNLTAVSLLREMGVLLTAILVAGRSGSAFAAELGTMQMNEEIDAMETMGMDPFEVLVLPRVAALVIMLPLLTVLADLVGLAGGALSAYLLMGLPPDPYLTQVRSALTPWTFWVGVMKAPVFAFLIGSVATFWGLRVDGSAESVGRSTTVSVVQSIFLVIAADAAFSILFTRLGI
ncbi:MAG TPA: MlaE family lipid ABC transporter permease subunit [Gammaproteobacteria bacterium]|nr:MlaE family lipid ABC transporter permease subunit [Gammaproteobacteria bacterium]